MTTATKEQMVAAVMIVKAVGDAIRDLGNVPSGHLYSELSGRMDINTYERIIATLVRTGLVRKSGHVLHWVEPAPTA